jgi:hypothetical protein
MQVTLEAIQFNHEPGSASRDAFNIRRNETEVVHVPEWRRGVSIKPEDSPAAYARDELQGRTPTIRAKFSFLGFDPAIQKVRIRALDGRLTPKLNSNESSRLFVELLKPVLREALSDNVLGSVLEREVRVKGGEEFELFNLDHVSIASAGVSVSDIIWRWQFRTNTTDWTDFATTTHRIFTVLDMPKAPWQPNSDETSNTQQPWVEVLDYACRWAAAAADVDEAAKLVTQQVNGLGPTLLRYDRPNGGSTGFTTHAPPAFDCTDFLLLLRDQPNRHGRGVTCDDCAAFVASFANVLGCDLWEAEMDNGNGEIPLHPHQRIGLQYLLKSSFTHHTVAWKGMCGEDDQLFDACLQLDSDDCPAQPPHPLFVPANIRFGQMHEHLYRFRLASDPTKCRPNGVKRRLRIAPTTLEECGDTLDMIIEFFGHHDIELVERTRITVNFFRSRLFRKEVAVAGWRLMNYRYIIDTDSLCSIQSFWRHAAESNAALRVDIHATRTELDARKKLKLLLSSYHLPDIVQQPHADFGKIVFAVPTNFAIVFIRADFAFQLRNIGERPVSGESLARFIDNLVASQFLDSPNFDSRISTEDT